MNRYPRAIRASTPAILRHLPVALGLPADARARRGLGGYVGGYFEDALSYVDGKVAEIHDAITTAPERGLAWARAQVSAAAEDLSATARHLAAEGASTAGGIVEELAQRGRNAVAAWGEGLGEAFKGFWGFTPGEGLGTIAMIGTGLALVAGAGLVYVLVSPGGQSYIASIGAGLGSGIAGMGQGAGRGYAALGGSLPATAAALARIL